MILVQDREQFEAALDILGVARIIAMDIETNGLHVHQGNRLTGISAHCIMPGKDEYNINFYFPFRHLPNFNQINLFTQSENLPVEWLPEFAPLLARDDLTLIFHNFKFDAKMLRAEDLWIDIEKLDHLYDTMVMAQMVDENSSHALKELGAIYFGEEARDEEKALKKLIRKAGGWEKVTPLQMAPYACKDAELTFRLAEVLGQKLIDQDLMRLWKREMTFQCALLEMEWEGIELDVSLAEHKAEETKAQIALLESQLGFDPGKRDELARILHGSQSQGGLGLPYLETSDTPSLNFPGGIPVMDETALALLKNPIADTVLELRGLVKANSTWYTGWQEKMGSDQRIHPTYNTGFGKRKYGTVTGRLSSSYPNIQQMPRDRALMVKQLLKPAHGTVTAEFDYAQIEYREAACYAEDEVLIQQFIDNIDTHQETADAIGIDRQSAKQAVYTILYGGSGPTLARNMENQVWLNQGKIIQVPDSRGYEIINAYYKLHPKMRNIAKVAENNAKTHGHVRLWTGRLRHFDPEQPWDFRKAFNSVLQGGAAEIIKDSMLQFYANRNHAPYRMLIQVHDSLWFQIPEENFDDHVEEIKGIMEWPGNIFPVPFPVDYKIIRFHELEVQVA